MNILPKNLVKYAKGYWAAEEENSGVWFSRFSEKQYAYFKKARDFWYERTFHSAGVRLEFVTDAKAFCMSFGLERAMSTEDSFDIYCDKAMIKTVKLKDENGSLISELSCELDGCEHEIIIYFPIDVQVIVTGFEISNGAAIRAVDDNKPKVLMLGDSITQGYGCSFSSLIYANALARLSGWDALNQGIGGYIYDSEGIPEQLPFVPELITVAFGTNDYNNTDFEEKVTGFYSALEKLYKGIPVFTATPLWRGSYILEKFEHSISFTKKVCAGYPDVHVTDGRLLTPHTPDFFIDGLHPNTLGCALYASSWYQKIQELIKK